MAVDTRYKRGSAISLLVPSMTPLAQPDTAGVSQLERQAVGWIYSGILATSNLISGLMTAVVTASVPGATFATSVPGATITASLPGATVTGRT